MNEEYIMKVRKGDQQIRELFLLANRSKAQLVDMLIDVEQQLQAYREAFEELDYYLQEKSYSCEEGQVYNAGKLYKKYLEIKEELLDGSDE